MPIVIPDRLHNDQLFESLAGRGALVISEHDATTQDIRPARVGILNLMPAASMEQTEVNWLRLVSQTVLQIEPVLIKFDDDDREQDGASRQPILTRYQPFTDVAQRGLDGLIVTGDNLELRGTEATEKELLPFDEILYAQKLAEIIDWARARVPSTVYSCLASHFILDHLYGIPRELSTRKRFGVFEHANIEGDYPILKGVDDVVRAPHSRWGNVRTEHLTDTDVTVLSRSESVGWLLAQIANQSGGTDFLLQGHPEYSRYDLHDEFVRDRERGQAMPEGYYAGNQPDRSPSLTWANDARALLSNWIAGIYKSFSGN